MTGSERAAVSAPAKGLVVLATKRPPRTMPYATALVEHARQAVDAMTPEERLLLAIFGKSEVDFEADHDCVLTNGAPRWDVDGLVAEQGWDTPGRCGRCGAPTSSTNDVGGGLSAAEEEGKADE